MACDTNPVCWTISFRVFPSSLYVLERRTDCYVAEIIFASVAIFSYPEERDVRTKNTVLKYRFEAFTIKMSDQDAAEEAGMYLLFHVNL